MNNVVKQEIITPIQGEFTFTGFRRSLNMETPEECKEVYRHAEDLYNAYAQANKEEAVTRVRAYALARAKEAITGKPYDTSGHNIDPEKFGKWIEWLKELDLVDKNGKPLRFVHRLLDYQKFLDTAETNHIKIIPGTEKEYRQFKTATKEKDLTKLAQIYAELANEYNEGKPFYSPKRVVEAVRSHYEKTTTVATETQTETQTNTKEVAVESQEEMTEEEKLMAIIEAPMTQEQIERNREAIKEAMIRFGRAAGKIERELREERQRKRKSKKPTEKKKLEPVIITIYPDDVEDSLEAVLKTLGYPDKKTVIMTINKIYRKQKEE